MSFAFKKFNFFQQHEVKIHGFPANSTCHCLGGTLLYVGCDNGTVHLLDEAFQSQGSLNAYGHKVLFIAWAPARQLLVTVGLEEPGISTATLKVWEAERVATAAATAAAASSAAAAISALPQPAAASAAAASLPPLRLHKLFSSKHPESEVTALAVTDDGSAAGHSLLIAVGLAAGVVHVFSGEVSSQKGKLTHTGKLQVRPDSGELWKVNALVFAAPQQQQQQQQQGRNGASNKDPAAAGGGSSKIAALGRSTPAASSGGAGESSSSSSAQQTTPGQQWLYVVTEAQTLAFNMADMSKTILDQQGLLASGCAVLQEGLLVLARDDALYEYTPETRAGCTAFEGLKQGLAKLRRYLVVTTDDTSPDGAASSQLHLLDVRNKLLAGSFGLQGLAAVVVGPGGLATWDKAGRLVRYFEVELSTQLEVLFKRSLHKLALDLALCHGADPQLIAAIRQRWGDHLYAKAEYEGAMAQYLETIGSDLEPSYVIRRFLDAQRIHSLTRYLEQLHAAGLGTADHTTLLLNCYTKLKDVGKLDAFLHRNAGSSSSSRAPAGGVGGGAAGMAVLAAAEKAARRNGKGGKGEGPQLSFDPETAFKVLRSAGYAQHALFVAEQAAQPEWILDVLLEDMGSFPEALAFIGMLSRRQQAQALQRYGKLLIGAAPDDTTALLMALCMPGPEAQTEQAQIGISDDAKADAKFIASVADYAQLYADRPTRLLYLCEFILFNSGEGGVPQEQQLYHTLLELYLAEQLVDHELQEAAAGSAAEVAPQARRDKARELLQRGWQPHMAQPKYDPEHALVLCRQHSYVPGLVLLYDKKRLYREVAALHMQAGDYSSLIAACVQYGDAAAGGDPQLWAEALEFFCSQPGDCSSAISQVLQHIEQGELLPPLVVLQTLAKNKSLKVSIVKDYVARQLQMEGKEIAKDRDTIGRLQAETSAMKAEAAKLKSQPHVFQSSRCAASGQALELPVVHFMCGHSFNLRSLGESDRECPLCAPDFRRVLDIRRNMKAGALKPDEFFSQLDASADGFGVVAEHFGRGVMNMTQQSMASQGAAAGAGAGGLGQL